MPLRIENGIPITPKAPGLQPLAEGLKEGEAGAAEEPHVLPVDPVTQEQDQWCWAACVEMVSTFFERGQPQSHVVGKPQCSVVGLKVGLAHPEDCCANEDEFSEEGCRPGVMEDVWEKCGIKATALLAVDPDQPALLKFADIQNEINNGRPIEVGIKWLEEHGGGGHAIIVKGWEQANGDDLVWVNDPLPKTKLHLNGSQGKIPLSELETANGFGLWLHTWTDIEPE